MCTGCWISGRKTCTHDKPHDIPKDRWMCDKDGPDTERNGWLGDLIFGKKKG